jgi:hypothetical protein
MMNTKAFNPVFAIPVSIVILLMTSCTSVTRINKLQPNPETVFTGNLFVRTNDKEIYRGDTLTINPDSVKINGTWIRRSEIRSMYKREPDKIKTKILIGGVGVAFVAALVVFASQD